MSEIAFLRMICITLTVETFFGIFFSTAVRVVIYDGFFCELRHTIYFDLDPSAIASLAENDVNDSGMDQFLIKYEPSDIDLVFLTTEGRRDLAYRMEIAGSSPAAVGQIL